MSVTARRYEPRGAQRRVLDSGQSLLVLFVGLLLIAAVAQTAAAGITDARTAVAFGALIALGELLRLNLPGDREAAPIAMAGALAYALLLEVGDQPARHDAQEVIAVTAIAMIVGALPHLAVGRPARLPAMAARLLAVAFVAVVLRPLAPAITDRWWLELPVMLSLVIAAWFVEAVIAALIRTDVLRARFGVSLLDELRVQLPLGAAVGASALLISFAAEIMGLAAIAVFTAPLLVTQVALRRYAGIRATYLQTVRALARVTEIGGYVEAGHSARVSRLAVAIGRELGMPEPSLLELEYAALMHDIGQLSLVHPIPGGATVLVSRADQDRIAELGSDVIRRAGVLDEVAELVRCQAWPARGHDPAPPLGSRIIRAANAFDDMVGSSTDRDRSAVAIDRMRLDPVGYDVEVVDALRDVAGRRVPSRL